MDFSLYFDHPLPIQRYVISERPLSCFARYQKNFWMQRSIQFHVLPHFEILQPSSASLDSQFMLIVHHSLLLPTFFFLGEFLLLKLVLKDINYTLALENATSDAHLNLKEVIYTQVFFFLFKRNMLKIQSYLALMSCFGRLRRHSTPT